MLPLGPVALAIAAYLIPFVVLFWACAERDRSLGELGLGLPCVFCLDLLSVLLLTLALRLETAVLVSRALWLVGGTLYIWHRVRRGKLAYPAALDWRELVTVLGAITVVVAACWSISAHYFIWDSEWHTSVVSSLVGQRLPFVNALSEGEIFQYHFSGDVFAAMLKSLSLQTLSSNRALALAHDLAFALAAATATLVVRAAGGLRGWSAALAGLAVLFHGPIPLRAELGTPFFGFTYHPFLNLSYRPHYAVGIVLLMGAMGCVLLRLIAPTERVVRRTPPMLLLLLGGLGITDETSLALFGLTLGVIWLVYPRVVAGTRRHGFALLVAVPVLAIALNLLFHAALSLGGPVQEVKLSPTWRLGPLSMGEPILPLTLEVGRRIFFIDLLPLAAGWLALAVKFVRRPTRPTGALTLAIGVLLVVTELLALRVDINGNPNEVHRFFVVPFSLIGLSCVAYFAAMPPGSTERALAVLGVMLPVVATGYWIVMVAPTVLRPWSPNSDPTRAVFATDCRAAAGARLGDVPRLQYVEPTEFYRYVGCRPVFSEGSGWGPWKTKILPIIPSFAQLKALSASLRDPRAPLDAICSNKGTSDPVCRYALRKRESCRREGSDYLRCKLGHEDRGAILAGK